MKTIAEKIVEAVLTDLRDRKGIGDELDMIDEEIYDAMKVSLVRVVNKAMEVGNLSRLL